MSVIVRFRYPATRGAPWFIPARPAAGVLAPRALAKRLARLARRLPALIACGLAPLSVLPAGAAEPVDRPAVATDGPEPTLALGVVALWERTAYRGVAARTAWLPLIVYDSRHLSIEGHQLDFKLPGPGRWSWRARLRYEFEGYKPGDSRHLSGMKRRRDGLWAGTALVQEAGPWTLSGEVLGDAAGHGRGLQARVQADVRLHVGETEFAPRVAVAWRDRRFVDHFYGVTGAEQGPGRDPYRGRASTDIELGLRLSQRLTPPHSLVADLETRRLGRGAARSPLAGRSRTVGLRLAYLYEY